MAADPFGNPGFLSGVLDGSLQGGGIKVMAAFLSTAWIRRAPGGREEVLPDEVARRLGVFGREGVRKIDFTRTGKQVVFVEQADALDLALQIGYDGLRERGDPVFFAFAVTDGN